MDISVIIRSKNEEEKIGLALESVFSQEVAIPFEVVLIDSGSSDNTLTIARKYPVRIFGIPSESFTFGHALNYGIERAKGTIIVNLSAHCIPLNDKWLASLTAPISEGRTHAVYGRQAPVSGMNPFEEFSLDKHFPEKEKKSGRVPFSNANCAFLKKMWEERRFDEALPSWEDYLWYLLLKDKYTFKYCPEAAVYHTHPFSMKAIERRAYNDGRAFRIFKERYGIDMLDSDYPSLTAKTRLFIADLINHMRFFLRKGYLKELFLIPVVRSLTFKAYRKGYRSLIKP